MLILGIESSCDETACALVRDGREVVANVVYTQIPLHRPYGGVVPEVASRAHVEKISGVVQEALARGAAAGVSLADVDAVAVTVGPGLAPALLVGLSAAKGLALALGKPLYCVNHVEAHLHTPFLSPDAPDPRSLMPALGLAVSGGHTNWIDMSEYGRYRIVGQTLDDAAGEAFDKAAKLLGLGYPGGPVIDKRAREWTGGDLIPFPKGRPRPGVSALAGLDADLCVSFSGLKTALLRYVERNHPAEAEIPRVCASYQEAIVGAIADRTRAALRRFGHRALVLGGGVSLNARLRAALADVAKSCGAQLLTAEPRYCGDNAAMIAALAYYRRIAEGDKALAADVQPSLQVGDEL